MPAEEAVKAAQKSAGYFASFIAGITIEPVPAKSAVEEPIIPPKNILVTTFTCARPPRNEPTNARAKSNNLPEMPPAFISPPAKTNSGKAIKTNLPMPDIIV